MFKAKLSLLKENISLMNTKSHKIKHDRADVESRELSPKNILDATNNHLETGNVMIPNNLLPTHLLNSTVHGMTEPQRFEHYSNSSSTSQSSSDPLFEPLLEKQKHIESKRTPSDDGSTKSLYDETNENTPMSKFDSDCSSVSEEISLHSLNSNVFNNSKIISFSNDDIHFFHPSNRTLQISVMAVDENVTKQSLDDNSFTSKNSLKSHSLLPETEYQSDFESITSSPENEENMFPKYVKNMSRPSSLTDKIDDRSSTESLQKHDQLKHCERYTSDENNAYNHYKNSVGVQTEENFNLPKLKQFNEMGKQAYKPKVVRNFNVSMQKSLQEEHRYSLQRNRMRCPVVQPVDLIRSTEKSNLSRGRLNFSGMPEQRQLSCEGRLLWINGFAADHQIIFPMLSIELNCAKQTFFVLACPQVADLVYMRKLTAISRAVCVTLNRVHKVSIFRIKSGMLVEQALDEMLRQQIQLTRHFIESHHKMYINYCKTVRDMNLDYRRL